MGLGDVLGKVYDAIDKGYSSYAWGPDYQDKANFLAEMQAAKLKQTLASTDATQAETDTRKQNLLDSVLNRTAEGAAAQPGPRPDFVGPTSAELGIPQAQTAPDELAPKIPNQIPDPTGGASGLDPDTLKAIVGQRAKQQMLDAFTKRMEGQYKLTGEGMDIGHKAAMYPSEEITAANTARKSGTEADILSQTEGEALKKPGLENQKIQAEIRKANSDAANPPRIQAENDHSYQYHMTQLEALRKPLSDASDRLARLHTTVYQNTPQADSLIAPELLTVMAGGQGSGLRLNEAEIARAVNGRSHWESIKAAVNKWQLDPTKALSVTPEQRMEIDSLLRTVEGRVHGRLSKIDATASQIASPGSTAQSHRTAFTGLLSNLDSVDQGQDTGAKIGPSTLVKSGGKMVPFSSLSPEDQKLILDHVGGS